ncbi:MAG: hypothetical protein COA79_19335 [Planctomycetota bacterium]|nr:MAG: hypothetical protein COA79_19335 [Planctomycetota bacterium]
MKYLFTIVITLLLFQIINCEEEEKEKSHGPWLTNFKTALSNSKKEDKPVFILFTGKDWCPPCKALEETILRKDKFLNYSKKNIILLELDFPQDSAVNPENEAISKQYGIKGFPTMLLVNHKGEPFQKFSYSNQTEKVFIDDLSNSINKNNMQKKFNKEPDEIKRLNLANDFMKTKLEGTNVIYFSKIFFAGLKNSKEINIKDKIIQLSDIYIYATENDLIDQIKKYLKEVDPKNQNGSYKLLHLKEFLIINKSHNDEKAYEFINKHQESFRGENAGYIHQFAMHIAQHGKFQKAMNLFEFIKADPILKDNPNIIARLQKVIDSLKEKINAKKKVKDQKEKTKELK